MSAVRNAQASPVSSPPHGHTLVTHAHAPHTLLRAGAWQCVRACVSIYRHVRASRSALLRPWRPRRAARRFHRSGASGSSVGPKALRRSFARPFGPSPAQPSRDHPRTTCRVHHASRSVQQSLVEPSRAERIDLGRCACPCYARSTAITQRAITQRAQHHPGAETPPTHGPSGKAEIAECSNGSAVHTHLRRHRDQRICDRSTGRRCRVGWPHVWTCTAAV